MRSYYNPYQNQSFKELWRRFYYGNKLLVWMMGLSLISMLLAGGRFFDMLYVVYLTYFGGVLFKSFFSEKKMLETFLWGGFFGILAYVLFFMNDVLWQQAVLSFFSSAALALLVAAATYSPHTEVMLVLLGRVKIMWIALIFVGLDLLTINPHHPAYRLSDLGGVLYALLSVYALKNTKGFFARLGFARKKSPLLKKKKPLFYKKHKSSRRSQRAESDEQYRTRNKAEQQEIDRILEKIKKSGYDTLSAEEKRKLFERSTRS